MAKNYFNVRDGLTEAGGEIVSAFQLLPEDLLSELKKLPQTTEKCLVIEKSLIRPLDMMLKKKDLDQLNITKVFVLDGAPIPSEWKYILYMVTPDVATTRIVVNLIKSDQNQHLERSCTIAFVPKRNVAVETLLENEGCLGCRIRIADFKLSCIPIDLDLVTLNCPQLFKSVFVDQDNEYLEIFADSLLRILTKLGLNWPEVRGRLVVGENSKKIVQMLDKKLVKPSEDTYPNRLAMNHTVTIALMDRDTDYTTALLSQMIYEGRLDDTYEINLGRVEVDGEIIDEPKPATLILDWKDQLFNDIRGLEPAGLSEELRKRSVEHREAAAAGKKYKTTQEMSRFVREDLKDLRQQQTELLRHYHIGIHLCEDLTELKRINQMERLLLEGSSEGCVEFLEEQLSLQEGLRASLRMLALWCVTQEGLPNQIYDSMVQLVCQSYGYQSMVVLYNMRRVGLLYPKKEKASKIRQVKSFSQVRKYLELLCAPQTETIGSPYKSGESYAFFGHHTPIISRLVERVFACSNKFKEEWFNSIPLTNCDFQPPIRFRGRQVIIIGFVGGCTYSEINSLRLLARYYNIQLVIVTSCTMNAEGLISQLEDSL